MFSPKRSAALGLLLLPLVTACGGGDSSGGSTPTAPAPSVPTTITITGSTTPLQSIGATTQLTATVRDQRGDVMTGVSVSWASANGAVAVPVPVSWTSGRPNHAAFRVNSSRTWAGVRYPCRSRSHPRL